MTLSIGLLQITMMYKIAVTIEYIWGLISFDKRNTRLMICYTVIILYIVLFMILDYATYQTVWWSVGDSNIFDGTTLAILFLVYLLALVNTL